MKKFASTIPFLSLLVLVQAAPIPDDRVVLYDMKSDPTIAAFINVKEIPGFFVMEIDELEGRAAIVYREGEDVFRSPADLKLKGNEISLKNKKNRRKWLRGTRTLPSGRTEEFIYSPDCPMEKDGWRSGPSYARHLVRRSDDIGRKLVAVQADLEFKSRVSRCGDGDPECGIPGCVDTASGTLASINGNGTQASTSSLPVKPSVKLSTAMIEATISGDEMLKLYKTEIDSALPARTNYLSALTTGYHTVNLPYPYMANPTFAQQNTRMLSVYKTYQSTTTTAPFEVEVAPLLKEYFPASPTKCGAWDTANPMRTMYLVRGMSALYIETPATGVTEAAATLVVCGRTISVSIHTESSQTREYMNMIYESLPTGQMENLIGGGN